MHHAVATAASLALVGISHAQITLDNANRRVFLDTRDYNSAEPIGEPDAQFVFDEMSDQPGLFDEEYVGNFNPMFPPLFQNSTVAASAETLAVTAEGQANWSWNGGMDYSSAGETETALVVEFTLSEASDFRIAGSVSTTEIDYYGFSDVAFAEVVLNGPDGEVFRFEQLRFDLDAYEYDPFEFSQAGVLPAGSYTLEARGRVEGSESAPGSFGPLGARSEFDFEFVVPSPGAGVAVLIGAPLVVRRRR